jgi:hypothetical protein
MLTENPFEGINRFTNPLLPNPLLSGPVLSNSTLSNPILSGPALSNPLLLNPLLPASPSVPSNQQTGYNPLLNITPTLSSFQLPFAVTIKNSLKQGFGKSNDSKIHESQRGPKNGKKLVLDLDETLVHTFAPKDNFSSFVEDLTDDQRKRVYALEFPGGETLFGYLRPGVENLIKTAFEEFESVGIWSAGTEFYVHEVVKLLFKDYPPLFIMTRNDCNELKTNRNDLPCRYKPLEIIYKKYPEHNESNTLIVDDRGDICKFNCLNNIQIPEFNLTSDNTSLLNDNSLDILGQWMTTDDFRKTEDVRTLKAKSPFKI